MEKTKPTNIDEYITSFPLNVQERLSQIREKITSTFSETKETIRYSMPAFKLGKEHLYISAYKKHIGMYPMYGLDELENELKTYRGKDTKDALHFPYDKPLPLDLIEKIVKLKVKQNLNNEENQTWEKTTNR